MDDINIYIAYCNANLALAVRRLRLERGTERTFRRYLKLGELEQPRVTWYAQLRIGVWCSTIGSANDTSTAATRRPSWRTSGSYCE